jgi:transposase
MPAPYHPHLRIRIIWAYLILGMTFVAIGSQFFIHERTARRYWKQYCEEGDVFPRPFTGVRRDAYFQMTEPEIEALLLLIHEDPCADIRDYARRYTERTGRPMTPRVFLKALHVCVLPVVDFG